MQYHLHLQSPQHLSPVSEDRKEIIWEQRPAQAGVRCAGECHVSEDAVVAQGAGTAQAVLSLSVPSHMSARELLPQAGDHPGPGQR